MPYDRYNLHNLPHALLEIAGGNARNTRDVQLVDTPIELEGGDFTIGYERTSMDGTTQFDILVFIGIIPAEVVKEVPQIGIHAKSKSPLSTLTISTTA